MGIKWDMVSWVEETTRVIMHPYFTGASLLTDRLLERIVLYSIKLNLFEELGCFMRRQASLEETRMVIMV